MFSIRYSWESLRQVLHYPSSLRLLFKGANQMGGYLNAKRISDWNNSRVSFKKTRYGFYIFLNPKDNDEVTSNIGVAGTYEMHVSELVRKILEKGGTVLDIGANIGWYSLLCAKIGAGKIISFEPEHSNLQLLKSSAEFNKFKNIMYYDSCVSEIEGYVELYINDEKLGLSSIVRQQNGRKIMSKSRTLDGIAAEHGLRNINLIKIDVEGAEPEVVAGGISAISLTKQIVMEWNGESWVDRMDLFKRAFQDFDPFEIVRSAKLVRPISLSDLCLNKSVDNIYLKRRA